MCANRLAKVLANEPREPSVLQHQDYWEHTNYIAVFRWVQGILTCVCVASTKPSPQLTIWIGEHMC